MKVVTVKGVTLGEGRPKICIPLVGNNCVALKQEIEAVRKLDADLVEWRGDCFLGIMEDDLRSEAMKMICSALPKTPVLFTFRTIHEGGSMDVSWQEYLELNKKVVQSKMVDLIDVESRGDEDVVKSLISYAKDEGVFVIASNHDFRRTPSLQEMERRLLEQQALGADIAKIAVMPESKQDVLTLLQVTERMSKASSIPIITMSMAADGLISRLVGEVFGSCLTFGSAVEASAPGQIPADELRIVLDIIHCHL